MKKHHQFYSKKVPSTLKKWLKVERFGLPIEYQGKESKERLKLIPFKCPMGDHKDDSISKSYRLYPEELVGHYYRQDLFLKYIIDLTNTDHYYNKDSVEELGVKHIKMPIPGKHVPTQEFLNEFISTMRAIEPTLAENEFVGIHCTHGINRTGYLIAYYMCFEKSVGVDQAIEAFNQSRNPHSIDKPYLIEDLQQRFHKPTEL